MSEKSNEKPKIEFFDPEDIVTFEPVPHTTINQPTEVQEAEISSKEPVEEYLVIEDDYFAEKLDQTSILRRREDYRGVLALVYTIATFLIFLVGIIIAVIDGLNRDVSIVTNLQEILPLLSGIFLGTLGFVLGYYFKRGAE